MFEITTASIVIVPSVGAHPEASWYVPPKAPHLTQVRSAESVDGTSSPTVVEALRGVGMQAIAPAVPSYVTGRPWILQDLPEEINTARILVYCHGKPAEGSTFDKLAANLLDNVLGRRKREVYFSKPLPKNITDQ